MSQKRSISEKDNERYGSIVWTKMPKGISGIEEFDSKYSHVSTVDAVKRIDANESCGGEGAVFSESDDAVCKWGRGSSITVFKK